MPTSLHRDEGAVSASRSDFFRELKSFCVPALKLSTQPPDPANSQELMQLMNSLVRVFDARGSMLNQELANYVFLPLSYVFRNQAGHPARLVELSLAVLAVLIEKGWEADLGPEHFNQLFILLLFILAPASSDPQSELPEEVWFEALRALEVLFRAASASSSASSAVADTSLVPSLGHAIVLLLDTAVSRSSSPLQLRALETLDAVLAAIKDHETLANFFPGVVSSLAKLLSPPLSRSQKSKVLQHAIDTLRATTAKVLGDLQTRRLFHSSDASARGDVSSTWLNTTADQLGLALSAVTRLQNHPSEDVRRVLCRMCTTLLDECHHSLQPCLSLLTETALALQDVDDPNPGTSLVDLASIYPDIGQEAKATVYAWISNTPRTMQQVADDNLRRRKIRDLFSGMEFLQSLRLDTPTLVEAFSVALRDSVAAVIRLSKPTVKTGVHRDSIMSREVSTLNNLAITSPNNGGFGPPVLEDEFARETRSELVSNLSRATGPSQRSILANKLLALLRESDGDEQVSAYWLALELLKVGIAGTQNATPTDMDGLVEFSPSPEETPISMEDMMRELYNYSVDTLSDSPTTSIKDNDERLSAIAMETITLTSSHIGKRFRPELMDVLYPVATFLGSESQKLQSHAMTTLNALAASCEYCDVAELMVNNVDYMVNTVALRLNSLDISPATTQVLRMMVRLSGTSLVPFLDDVVESIFGALENYHGYPSLVDNLFSVLIEIAEQCSRVGATLIAFPDQKRGASHLKSKPRWTTIEEVQDFLLRRRARNQKHHEAGADDRYAKGHPSRAWKVLAGEDEEKYPQVGDEEKKDEENEVIPTPSYALLARITTLTQHYLTSPIPQLRRSLLELVALAAPALAPNEKEFLPIVNTVWPVAFDRFWDSEPYVAVEACKTLAILCESTGDFLASRLGTAWSKGLYNWMYQARDRGHVKGAKTVAGRMHSWKGGAEALRRSSSYSQAAQRWDGAKKLLLAMVLHVRMDEAIFDDICRLLADDIIMDGDLRHALETRNSDAVFMLKYAWEYMSSVARPRGIPGAPEFIPVVLKVGEE
ncbi:TEL2-interacting protein 1 [Zalerion maritima]|uniref:TEL2-interacting protein 1 n=1 Tax=Zalerion maritima TaxID=339359 RepID=A0AAD5WVF9_9PEZI|nr:TEL2-interacting protein 1 [Zalerion maritima]